ncbi:hypothetical protein NOJ05_01865 [Neorhizobium galegae]|uniref:hypothetical protein n=1 Tax=Neorhizobium galegae TaxID=399 RepID=UPI0021069408|nr:hypothetical protein [Neorhizobium galegae]MCQ1775938.1 hypothetical protein [Neorhizobium galegae]MCQ1798081.1 hypothetical protein [Neorhizobium galegae]
MKMIVSFVPLVGPKGLLIVLDEDVELKSFGATTNDYKVRGRNINVSVSRGLASFELIVTDLSRERSETPPDVKIANFPDATIIGFPGPMTLPSTTTEETTQVSSSQFGFLFPYPAQYADPGSHRRR